MVAHSKFKKKIRLIPYNCKDSNPASTVKRILTNYSQTLFYLLNLTQNHHVE